MVNDHPRVSASKKKRKKASKRGSTTGRALAGGPAPPTVIGLQPMLKRYDVFKSKAVAVAPRADSPSSAGPEPLSS